MMDATTPETAGHSHGNGHGHRATTPEERAAEDKILEEWAGQVVAAFALEGFTVDIKAVLGLAGRAANAVLRPAAPLTTFLAGYAAGRAAEGGEDSDKAVARMLATATQMCRDRQRAAADDTATA